MPGLILKKPKRQTFRYEKMFGAVEAETIPDFIVAEPLEIKNQYNSDLCVSFATCAVSEDQEGILLSPEWFFAQIKKLQGDWRTWGVSLHDGAKTAVKVGFIAKEHALYNLIANDRDFIADWSNWPEMSSEAIKQRKDSYFVIEGSDMFESIKSFMWQNRAEKRSVLTGCKWDSTWDDSADGIVKKEKGIPLFAHAFKIFGLKTLNGEEYLMAQLSNGDTVGDNGILYFPKEVINRELKWGAYCFKDISPEQAKQVCWTWYQKLWSAIKNYFKDLLW